MQSYLISYAHDGGFGRQLISRTKPIDEAAIFDLEKKCAEAAQSSKAAIVGIFPISGPITPQTN